MKARQTLAEEFARPQAARDEAQREFEKGRGLYFHDRRRRAQLGLELEALEVTDSNVWNEQLAKKEISRKNGVEDRRAGLTAA